MQRRWWFMILGLLLSVGILSVLIVALTHHKQPTIKATSGSSHILKALGNNPPFQPFYFTNNPPEEFSLEASSIDYQAGVLVFALQNSVGKTLAITEQATPKNYDTTGLSANSSFQTATGQAYISNDSLRTTGTLFTQNGTWLLINAPNPIGVDDMQTVINDLEPLGHS